MLEKGKPDKAEKILDKAIEKNDTLPAVLYAESMLLFDSSYSTFDMDKSYTKLLQSKSGFSKLDEKLMEKHAKIGVDLLTLDKLKKRIEKAAFLRALAQNTERDYIYFLNVFKDTEHDDQVVLNRDSLAFLYASNEDTYESYNKFMNKYPRAKQIPLAKERYERLYFNKSTADGKLESYVKFLDDYPATEYRVDAEKRIFEILTAGNTADSFRKFVTAYPDSYLVSKAKRLSYYLENSQKGLASDSLQNANEFMVHKELIAIYDKGKYGFMSVEGKVIIEPKYNYIDQDYMCEPLTQDYFVTHSYIVARNGTIIFDEAVQKVDELGLGVLKVSTPSGVYALHKSGWKVTATSYNDFKVIGDFIGYRSREKWGLMTLSGLKITDPLFTDISKYGSFYLFNFEERFDVLNLKVLVNSANNTSNNVQPLYTDFEFLNNQYIWLKTDLGEVVLDGDLNEVIPYNQQKISSTTNGYLVKREKQIY
mgnify:CR=1 FL=1